LFEGLRVKNFSFDRFFQGLKKREENEDFSPQRTFQTIQNSFLFFFMLLIYIKICDYYARPIRKKQFFRGNMANNGADPPICERIL